ncbi:MAG: hypothetical protein QM800_14945 [Paludibacter sp.]
MKKLFGWLIVFTCIIAGTFHSCYYDKEEQLYPSLAACDTTNITYSQKIAPILNANCLSCHGNSVYQSNGGGVKLQDYPDVKANINPAYDAVVNGRMPKGAKLDDCSITAIGIWKNAGAPNN